jgi:predicted aspartyl protease
MKVRYGMAATLLLTLSLGLLDSAPRRETKRGGVPFDYVPNSSLIVLPVMINKHGPYKLVLDTGTTRTILSAKVADKLGLPKGRIEMLFSTSGNSPVTIRSLRTLEVGGTKLENIEISSANLPVMKMLNIDGLLGSDFLHRFRLSIDYDHRIVDLQPCCDGTMSSLLT